MGVHKIDGHHYSRTPEHGSHSNKWNETAHRLFGNAVAAYISQQRDINAECHKRQPHLGY